MSNLIKTSDGKLIKYSTDATYITCQGFATNKPLPQSMASGLSGLTVTSQYYGKEVQITNGDEVATYQSNADGSFTSRSSVSPVTTDAIFIVSDSGLSPNYKGKYYLRSTKTWSAARPTVDKLIKIN